MDRNKVLATLALLTTFILGCITVEVNPAEETAVRTKAAFPSPTWTTVVSLAPTVTRTQVPSPTIESSMERTVSRVFFADQVTGGSEPVSVASEFPGGTDKVYAFVTYAGMTNGLSC